MKVSRNLPVLIAEQIAAGPLLGGMEFFPCDMLFTSNDFSTRSLDQIRPMTQQNLSELSCDFIVKALETEFLPASNVLRNTILQFQRDSRVLQ